MENDNIEFFTPSYSNKTLIRSRTLGKRTGEVSRRSSFTSRYNSWGRDLIERTGRRKGEECDKLIKANPKLMIQNIEIITKIRVLTNKIGNTRANGCRTTAHQSSKLLTTTYQWFPI